MRRLIWLPVAGFLLIAGAAAASAAPGLVNSSVSALTGADPSAEPSVTDAAVEFRDGLLTEVLDELVAANVITQQQADAVTDALRQKVEDRRAELEALRQQWQEFIADGVITQGEIDQLPDDNPLRQAWDSIAEDGQVTLEQLRQIGPFGGHGPGRGHIMWGFDAGRGHHAPFDWPAAPDDTEEQPE